MKSRTTQPLHVQTTRREFLQVSLAGALSLAVTSVPVMSAEPGKRARIGFQLYTLRGEFAGDVPGTLKKLGKIGYEGVEFWGFAGTAKVYQQYSAADLRKLLDDTGLACCGMHLELKALGRENLQQTVENNQVLGSRFLNVAAAKQHMETEKGIAELAELLNEAAARCAAHQMQVGYHAHPFDFVKIKGEYAWDLLFSRTRPDVNMQMDVGNCLGGDGDPIGSLKKFPGRARTIHVKEHADKTFDSPYYREVFALCPPAVTSWYIVEQGGDQGKGFEVPSQALAKLRRVLS